MYILYIYKYYLFLKITLPVHWFCLLRPAVCSLRYQLPLKLSGLYFLPIKPPEVRGHDNIWAQAQRKSLPYAHEAPSTNTTRCFFFFFYEHNMAMTYGNREINHHDSPLKSMHVKTNQSTLETPFGQRGSTWGFFQLPLVFLLQQHVVRLNLVFRNLL